MISKLDNCTFLEQLTSSQTSANFHWLVLAS